MARRFIKQDQTMFWTCVASAHLQCVNTHYAKFEYKGMKLVGVTDYTDKTQYTHSKGGVIMSKFKNSQKYNKILSNVYKIDVAYLQCVNN